MIDKKGFPSAWNSYFIYFSPACVYVCVLVARHLLLGVKFNFVMLRVYFPWILWIWWFSQFSWFFCWNLFFSWSPFLTLLLCWFLSPVLCLFFLNPCLLWIIYQILVQILNQIFYQNILRIILNDFNFIQFIFVWISYLYLEFFFTFSSLFWSFKCWYWWTSVVCVCIFLIVRKLIRDSESHVVVSYRHIFLKFCYSQFRGQIY